MPSRRIKESKKRTLCLRLTEKQFAILQLYTDVKGFDTEVEALRHIVDGLEAWLTSQAVAVQSSAPPAISSSAALPAMDGNQGVM